MSPFLQKVCVLMSNLGKGCYNPECTWAEDETAVGEELYLEVIRPELIKADVLPKAGKAKKDPKAKPAKKEKSVKYDDMKRKIASDRVRKDVLFMVESFSFDRLNVELGLNMKKIELKLSTFLYICIFFAKNRTRMEIKIQQVYELIFILSKLLKLVDGLQKEACFDESRLVEVSPSCVRDLRECMLALSQHYEYSIAEVLVAHPKLIYLTSYDRFFSALNVRPYRNQEHVMRLLETHVTARQPFVLFYRAMIGAGKTTLALAISHFMQLDYRVIYCCTVESVRKQVGRLAYNSCDLKLAIAAVDHIRFPSTVKNKDKFVREYKEAYD